ncbi:MAG: dTDP-4-dehydrorhamnose 3,5-epimerase family protein [Planctomycetia bacterium]|nr:dTDP-4-dehydrorhamnose 3,5-epimerase family protein [Planctomycetia bacterium]
METKLKGSFVIEPERFEDGHGFFARARCKREFEVHGLNSNLMQYNTSFKRNVLQDQSPC